MPPLPVVSGADAVRAFERAGWRAVRRESSHVVLIKPGVELTLSVPQHKELDRGTLRSLLRKADLAVEEFVKLLGKRH